MRNEPAIPIRLLSREETPRLAAAAVLARLPEKATMVAYRAPDPADPTRWKQHLIGNRRYWIAQPVTFTPYASAIRCSARCRFCSETLVEKNYRKLASALRPDSSYFSTLGVALEQLIDLPLSYSLSGLETTDHAEWMLQLLDKLQSHARRSPVNQRVLYTNGAGLCHRDHGRQLLAALEAFEIDWVELSRHHFDGALNQSIMRFRSDIEIRDQTRFEETVRSVKSRLPVKLVCIVQQGGVSSADQISRYLQWARRLGVSNVIFREFSKLDDQYADNATTRYMTSARVGVDSLLMECLTDREFSRDMTFERVTEGYYFWNLVGRYQGMEVTFESSDYALMHRQHDSGRVYKLVFHANGNLCADWNPERHVLLRAGA